MADIALNAYMKELGKKMPYEEGSCILYCNCGNLFLDETKAKILKVNGSILILEFTCDECNKTTRIEYERYYGILPIMLKR
jgi:hypothetical protein